MQEEANGALQRPLVNALTREMLGLCPPSSTLFLSRGSTSIPRPPGRKALPVPCIGKSVTS